MSGDPALNKHIEDLKESVRLRSLAGAMPACRRIVHMLSADAEAALVTASKESAAATAAKVAWWAAKYAAEGTMPEGYKKLEAENEAKAVAAFEDAKREEAAVCARVERLKEEIRNKAEFQLALLTGITQFHTDSRFMTEANAIVSLLARRSVPSGGAGTGGTPSGGAGRPRNAKRR